MKRNTEIRTIFVVLMLLMSIIALISTVASLESPGIDTDTVIPDSTSETVCTTDGTLDDILVITYNWGYPTATHIEDALVGAGYTVTALYNPAPGVISTTLAANGYAQVWLWDITTTLGLTDAGDKAALGGWYNTHRGNIIIDARSYGAWYDYGDDKKFIENEAYAFSLRNRGLWIGTDHDPAWTKNGNALLVALGYATVTGVYPGDKGVDGGDTTCELLTTPNLIPDPTILYAFSTVGSAPTGVQSDGVDLKPLLWNIDETVYTSYALTPVQNPLWHEINEELDTLKGNVSNATMPSIIKQRLIDKLEYAKALKENAKIECKAGNFEAATKKLGVAKSQVESFASMVKITRRICPADKASFLADSTEIIGKIQALIEYIETEHRC